MENALPRAHPFILKLKPAEPFALPRPPPAAGNLPLAPMPPRASRGPGRL